MHLRCICNACSNKGQCKREPGSRHLSNVCPLSLSPPELQMHFRQPTNTLKNSGVWFCDATGVCRLAYGRSCHLTGVLVSRDPLSDGPAESLKANATRWLSKGLGPSGEREVYQIVLCAQKNADQKRASDSCCPDCLVSCTCCGCERPHAALLGARISPIDQNNPFKNNRLNQ